MKINVKNKGRAEKVPVSVEEREPTPAEIVDLMRVLDNETFKTVIRASKKVRKSDRILGLAFRELENE